MSSPAAPRRRPVPADRSNDRLVVLAALGIALVFLLASLVSMLLPPETRQGAWLPLHLALAGAAATAIAGVMPFFSAALAAAPPAGARLRFTAVGAVSAGALAVSVGVIGQASVLAVAGGLLFITGAGLTGLATVRPLRRALGPSRGLVTRAYVLALSALAAGAALATIFLAGWPPLVESWAHARGAHAWLNLVGFVSLVIATTLLHFFPTVVGARIVARPSARLTVAGLALGAPLVALGLVLGSDPLARIGAVCSLGGAAALAVYAAQTWRTRARWTSDRGWHRFAMGGLVCAIGWFEAGMALAAGRVLLLGSEPAAWSIDVVAGPLVAGWMSQAVVASATHLVPAIGPGSPVAHASQRRLLGRDAELRLAGINGGAAALALGLPLGLEPLQAAAVPLLGLGLGSTALLLGVAVRVGLRPSAP
jgi:hypothetical protein